MITTVCELPNEPEALESAWKHLADHTAAQQTELLLLPEMPFYRWLPGTSGPDTESWRKSAEAHERWIEQFASLGPEFIAGTRPVTSGDKRYNSAFIWTAGRGLQSVHEKYYLPDEPGYWEATWYSRGEGRFDTASTPYGKAGFLVCTELWFTRHAREYAKQGVRFVLCPRATPDTSVRKWVAGGVAAAVVSGAYCLSSNLSGEDFGGTGWIIEPEEGAILGTTSPDQPFLTLDIDPGKADLAKESYPRYVKE